MSATLSTPYRIRASRMWLIHDAPPENRIEEIAFHVKSGDYFATLATILMLLEDSLTDCLKRNSPPSEFQIASLQAQREELMHLHEHYTILPKKES